MAQAQITEDPQQPQNEDFVNVNAETYLAIQLAKIDDEIAAAKIARAQIDLKITQLEKSKTQSIIEFHYGQMKLLKQKETQKAEKPVEAAK